MTLHSPTRRCLTVAALAIMLAALSGCGQKTTDVTGKVAYKGKPVVTGNVTLIASDGTSHSGTIGSDGSYTIAGVPVGPAKLGVTSADPAANPAAVGRVSGRDSRSDAEKAAKGPAAKGPAGEKVAGWFPLPDGVSDPNKSNLTGTVEPGKPLDITIP